MSQDFSKQSFLDFLDYLANKGLVNKSTVSSRKAAANALLDILDDGEAADLRNIDVDDLAQRFSNLRANQFTPTSLNTYKSRFSSALEDFLSYKADPAGFKPSISPRARRSARSSTNHSQSTETNRMIPETGFQENAVTIQIRDNVKVSIVGLPSDLTSGEARKISKIVNAFAEDDD